MMPTWKCTDDADTELKAAMEALEAGQHDAVKRMQVAVDGHELAWAKCYLIKKEELGIDK